MSNERTIYEIHALAFLSKSLSELEELQKRFNPTDWARIIDAMYRINAERQTADEE